MDVQTAKDVVVEEDVGIYSNVTLLSGITIGRGAVIGSGSVCRRSIPPYAIVAGNPAKVIGFRFSPEEVIEHEKVLYPETERLQFELLQKNYQKYFLSRHKEIKSFLSL
jgi:serine acetyltransferase